MSSTEKPTTTPYEMLGGDQAIRDLADAFYEAMDSLPEAAKIRAMHGESLVDIKQKLYEYLSGWLGGPSLYVERYGTICLTEPHAPYAIGEAESDQWMQCMEQALEKIEASEEVKQMLLPAFTQLANFIQNTKE